MQRILIRMIRFYQSRVSPLFGASCRFYPSCSAYALTAVQRHGTGKGLLMAARRILRCHPFHPGGVDPVP